MKPNEVRARILADHEAIREMLTSLEALARSVASEAILQPTPLREDAQLLLDHLRQHMCWEDLHLEPLLIAGGEIDRAKRLERDHVEQRELLEHALERMRDRSRPIALVAVNVLDLIELLREDIRDEEEHLLDVVGD